MSEKIKLDEAQMLTLASALQVAALATYYHADVAEQMGEPTVAAGLRSQAEDYEFLLALAPQVERITVRLSDSSVVTEYPKAPYFG